jgi:hypothetical protein
MFMPMNMSTLPTNDLEEMAAYNETIRLMNNTYFDGEEEFMSTMVDEACRNCHSFILIFGLFSRPVFGPFDKLNSIGIFFCCLIEINEFLFTI